MKKLTEQLELDDDRPDITPMIDVIFMLLLFFIVTTTFAAETFFPLELPTAETVTVRAADEAAVIEISRDGELALNREFVVSFEALYEQLGEQKRAGAFRTVVIKADEAAPAGSVVSTLDVLRGLGIAEFAVTAHSAE